MTPHHPHRCSIQCIVPPHMLRVLAMRAEGEVQRMARTLLAEDAAVRARRSLLAVEPEAPPETKAVSAVVAGAAPTGPDRRIHDGEGRAALPGRLARGEGDGPTGDGECDAAYDGAGAVHALFAAEYGRDSLDGRGLPLVATVHHRRDYNNAFWNGTQMAYGDGDGRLFRTFTELSVIGHEMTHGVVQFSGGLVYEGQSGALNESVSDVFGALTKQRERGEEAHEADWLLGAGILGPDIRGTALRSMRAPGTAYADPLMGTDPQPFHMDLYVDTTDDNGGVHINSGIPNHAFYLYARELGGRAWERPGRIWYRALQEINNPMASFGDWAVATMDAATALHGVGAWEAVMLRRAWRLVGIAL